jgi:transcriptional regulator with XRE-family HTH domain
VSLSGISASSLGPQTRGTDHELVILAHLVQMVKAVRNIPDIEIAQKLGVSPSAAAQMLSESARLTLDELRQLFLAVGMTIEGIFETSPGEPEKTVLSPMGFGNAIEQGLEILNEESAEEARVGEAASP